MTRRPEIMMESLSALASRHGWSLEAVDESTYSPGAVLYREDLAIAVRFDIRDADIGCTCYWLPGPYETVRGDESLSSVCLYSFGLHEFITARADSRRAKQDRKRLFRSVRPEKEELFKAHLDEVAELIEIYASDVLAGDHEALQRLGRAGYEGRRRGYSSPERDAADGAFQDRYWQREKRDGIGCGVIIALVILALANSCHR